MRFRDLPLKIKIKHRLFHLAKFQFEKWDGLPLEEERERTQNQSLFHLNVQLKSA